MKTMSARDATKAFVLMIDAARAQPVLTERRWRCAVRVIAVATDARLTIGLAPQGNIVERSAEAAIT